MGWVGRVSLFLLLLFFVFLLAFIFGVAVVAVCLFVCLFFQVDFSFQPYFSGIFMKIYCNLFKKNLVLCRVFCIYITLLHLSLCLWVVCLFWKKKQTKKTKKNKNVSLANWRCVKASFLLRLSDNSNLIFG